MRTRLILKPGQRGTKRLGKQYGDRLLCVRYRYDEKRRKRLKTVELIVDEVDWQPSGRCLGWHLDVDACIYMWMLSSICRCLVVKLNNTDMRTKE